MYMYIYLYPGEYITSVIIAIICGIFRNSLCSVYIYIGFVEKLCTDGYSSVIYLFSSGKELC